MAGLMWNLSKKEFKFLSLINKIFAIVQGKESKKVVMIEQFVTEDSTMTTTRRDQHNEGSSVGGQMQHKSNKDQQKSTEDYLW